MLCLEFTAARLSSQESFHQISTFPELLVGGLSEISLPRGVAVLPLGGTHHVSPSTLSAPCRQASQHELAERLVECQYELTDRLAFYLCGRKPGKASGGVDRVPKEEQVPGDRWDVRTMDSEWTLMPLACNAAC